MQDSELAFSLYRAHSYFNDFKIVDLSNIDLDMGMKESGTSFLGVSLCIGLRLFPARKAASFQQGAWRCCYSMS